MMKPIILFGSIAGVATHLFFKARCTWLLLLVIALINTSMAASPLRSFNIDSTAVSVSGVSSGGYLAQQFHIAYSASVMGAAIIAAGPYLCAGTGYPMNLWRVLNRCMDADDLVPFMGPPPLQDSIEITHELARQGLIDEPANLRHDNVFLFSGSLDETVPPAVVESLYQYYLEFVDSTNISYINHIPAGHGMITDDAGNTSCSVTASPFINDCDYDSAGMLLQHIYGDSLLPPGQWNADDLVAFDQREFSSHFDSASLDETGYVYVPGRCRSGASCRLHVALHGCRQHVAAIGDQFYKLAGYNEWAQTNDIIVLYPQAAPEGSWLFPWPNPRGCWDWWGYTGSEFHTRNSIQMSAIMAMIDRLMGR